MIQLAKQEQKEELINFLVQANGERNDKLAREYVACCFSDDYRKPHFVVYIDNNKILGAAAYSQELFTTSVWGISWVCVDEKHRNKGIGEKVVQFCLKQIADNIENDVHVILGTYPNKTGLYDKTNFEEIYKDKEHGSFMIKKIAPDLRSCV